MNSKEIADTPDFAGLSDGTVQDGLGVSGESRVIPFPLEPPEQAKRPVCLRRGTIEWLESLLNRNSAQQAKIQKSAGRKRLTQNDTHETGRSAIKEWPENDRPRERLLKFGPQALSDTDLLAILIRTGDPSRGQNAIEQARELLKKAGSLANISRMSAAELHEMAGLGPAKASQVLAALALAPRLDRALLGERPSVSNSETAFRILREHYGDPAIEEVVTLLLDTRNNVLRAIRCARGGVGSVSVEQSALFRDAIREGAAGLILSHNHPSGDPTPSEADRRFTKDAVTAGKILSVRVLDHLVIAGPRYFSFLDEGFLG